MSDLDARLTAALHADTPPAHDVRFRVEVLARLERTQLRRRAITAMAVAVTAAVLVAVNVEAISAWMAMDGWRVWIVALGAAAAMFILPGVPVEAGPGARMLVSAVTRWLYP